MLVLKFSYCEIFARYIAAHLRVLIGMELVRRYGYSQFRAAKEVEVAQPLLNYLLSGKGRSPYLESLRSNEDIMEVVKGFAERIARGEKLTMCGMCSELRKRGLLAVLVKNIDVCRKRCDAVLPHL